MRRASAYRINVVTPYFGYARQDRKTKAREPITAKLVANLIEKAGADRVIAADLHAGQIQGFFDIPVDHLTGIPLLAAYFKEALKNDLEKDRIVVISPDIGGVVRARRFAVHLNADLAIVDKRRSHEVANLSEVMEIIGDVNGKIAILVDDIIDTAGTMVQAAEALKLLLGAPTETLLVDRLFVFDAWRLTARTVRVMRRETCPLCGERKE